jgi:hypothetical protein
MIGSNNMPIKISILDFILTKIELSSNRTRETLEQNKNNKGDKGIVGYFFHLKATPPNIFSPRLICTDGLRILMLNINSIG